MDNLRNGSVVAVQSVGVSLQEVAEKKHNIWVGVSFGNRQFTPENTNAVVAFALRYTRDRVLVILAGRMHAANIQHLAKDERPLRRAKALRLAYGEEDERRKEIEMFLATLPEAVRTRVRVVGYSEACNPTHMRVREILYREFSEEGRFYHDVIDIVRENVERRGRTPTPFRLDGLAIYVLNELPWFLVGAKAIDDNTLYTVNPYPSLGKLDDLVVAIRSGAGDYAPLRERIGEMPQTGVLDLRFEDLAGEKEKANG